MPVIARARVHRQPRRLVEHEQLSATVNHARVHRHGRLMWRGASDDDGFSGIHTRTIGLNNSHSGSWVDQSKNFCGRFRTGDDGTFLRENSRRDFAIAGEMSRREVIRG